MMAEMAAATGDAKLAASYRDKAAALRPKMEELFLKPDGTVRYGLLHGANGYEPVEYHWTTTQPDGKRLRSSNRHEVAFTWGLTLLPPELRVFSDAQRDKTLLAFDANRWYRKTFDEILFSCVEELRDRKLAQFVGQAGESRRIDSGFYGDLYKGAIMLSPYGIPELIDQGRKPQAFTITPTLYWLVEHYRDPAAKAVVP